MYRVVFGLSLAVSGCVKELTLKAIELPSTGMSLAMTQSSVHRQNTDDRPVGGRSPVVISSVGSCHRVNTSLGLHRRACSLSLSVVCHGCHTKQR
ncbi:hypothetical protein E2C01_038996 [Portunus trituberculatus]|uniref:Uncharacterized protein n=1 Tax=Portunus trituberculatus TaxID=210409 RepID=A0A5B7FDM3_PORTR|nr:hypothetical protein [Portunus trituberculatus]